MIRHFDICIIGGGASGLMAAIAAGSCGKSIAILEQLDRVGKKLLATGNGRCNITNANMDIKCFHGSGIKEAERAFQLFGLKDTVEFFESIGISCRTEDGGKIFPRSGQASAVLDVLRYEAEKLGAEEILKSQVTGIRRKDGLFILSIKNSEDISADRVIVCTGGKASPNLGSTGSGIAILENLGHKAAKSFPALVQLKLSAPFLKALSGVKFDGEVSVTDGESVLRRERGEILYTDYGISGPPVLQLSRIASEYTEGGKKVYIDVDMFPDMNMEEIINLLSLRISKDASKEIQFSFIGLINKKMIPVILKQSGIEDIHRKCGSMGAVEIQRAAEKLKGWRYEIVGTRGWAEAQVTAGGILMDSINPETMESKLVKGLHICGELIDVDGDCGGYNLQWAWTSGYLAGKNAAESKRNKGK